MDHRSFPIIGSEPDGPHGFQRPKVDWPVWFFGFFILRPIRGGNIHVVVWDSNPQCRSHLVGRCDYERRLLLLDPFQRTDEQTPQSRIAAIGPPLPRLVPGIIAMATVAIPVRPRRGDHGMQTPGPRT